MSTEPLTEIWPKKVPALTPEQHRIQEDWIHHWLNVLPKRYGRIERFNHTYPARHTNSRGRTLEIGAGLGEQFITKTSLSRSTTRSSCGKPLRQRSSRGFRP